MEDFKRINTSKWLIENDILDKADIKIYEYGLKQGIMQILNIALAIMVGVAMNMLLETIIFLVSYISLRVYAGGYHAKDKIRCFCWSTILILLALIAITNIYLFPKICIGVLAISTIIIHKLAPIEAKKKPLDKMEVIVYRRKTITILWILILISLLLLFLDLQIYFASVVVAIASVSIMLMLGKCLVET